MAAELKGKRRTVRTAAAAVLLGTALAATGSLDSRLTAVVGPMKAAEAAKLGATAFPATTKQADRLGKAAKTSASRSRVAISALSNASFLKETGFPEAWKLLRRDVVGTIAIVDTGIDLKNAALQPYLTEGVNLLDDKKPPQDDNGHGTAVAGVIVAAAEAAKGANAEAAWKMKLMPVKALDDKGEGDEARLSGGIRYAIEHGADIVVLSLGLRRDAPGMRSVIDLAESKGVLLVAATGNDAADFGERAAVQYPAAYPTVLAVAGAEAGKGQINSTGGPEVDLAASWQVDTLALGGGRLTMEGTSMAAPQVAAAVALLRAAHPEWKPAFLRETLRRTAEDIGAKGRDDATGYGLLRADQALSAAFAADWREPNGAQRSASPFPPGTEVYSAWSGLLDTDWYAVEAQSDGMLSVRMQTNLFDIGPAAVKLSLYLPGGVNPIAGSVSGTSGGTTTWKVSKGKYYLRVDGSSRTSTLPYRLTSGFRMLPDRTEPGSTRASAYAIEPRTQTWSGTFDREDDNDWTTVKLPQSGTLKVTVETDTTRIDPAITLQRVGQAEVLTDTNGDGLPETATIKNAPAGRYYIGVSNAAADGAPPVIGTYTVRLEYITTYADLGEPNDGPLTAASLVPGEAGILKGLISSKEDADWFRFKTTGGRFAWKLEGIPEDSTFKLAVYDKQLKLLGQWSGKAQSASLNVPQKLAAGTYYARITADRADRSAYYRFGVTSAD
ncbi:S8 family serine peptidase [Cohnella hashimotonis]|uniref:S8 family serine peptidase n=1 Tax=Cohnella hashimotonis TaxID=2826895 RepID=A0ABT6TTU4_9BACL|nr:S8 family serine peptidase [Cohnella hashimotonis]MDI4650268.1 S8 family serine peptidase [Cohnella hashimotonis]